MTSATATRLGLLGGSFDPIHRGHVAIARAARDARRLDRVLLAPSGSPPHKGVVAPAEHRLAMVRLAIGDEPGLEATDRELRREGPSYTVETLREIRGESGEAVELFFIVGADSLPELPSWRAIDEIVRLARIVAVTRTGTPLDPGAALGGRLPEAVLRRMREDAVEMEPVPVSSTDIRDRLARGLEIGGLVPPAVEAYIREHGLYTQT